MISIQSNKNVINKDELSVLQRSFENEHVFVIRQFLSLTLQSLINSYLKGAEWYVKSHPKKSTDLFIGKEYALDLLNPLYKVLHFYLNHPEVLNTIREITGLIHIKSFNGRIYKFEKDENCYDDWHSDIDSLDNDRLVGISVNLSPEVYQGGVFSLRNKKSKRVYRAIHHQNWGAAHFFRISPELEHMVSRAESKATRLVYAGWFSNSEIKVKI